MKLQEFLHLKNMPSYIEVAVALAIVVCLWPLAIYCFRWWKKPYNKPNRILSKLQSSLRLSRADRRHLKTLLANNSDPISACQFVLDPSRWPIDKSTEATKKLYFKIFDQP